MTTVSASESVGTDITMLRLKGVLETLLADIKRETRIPGIALALSIGGRHLDVGVGTLAVEGELPITTAARFQLGCITKLLVAMLAGEMIERRELDAEASLSKYLPELANTKCGDALAVWHLLSHTSGYQGVNLTKPDTAYYYSWEKFLAHLRDAPQHFTPGTVFSYEHTEYVILGEIIERLTGRKIDDLLHEQIFEPLQLSPGRVRGDQRHPEVCVVDHFLNPATKKFGKLVPIPFGGFWRASLSDLTMSLKDLLRIGEVIPGFGEYCTRFSRGAMDFVQKQVVKLPRTHGSKHHEQLPGAFGLGCAAYQGWLLGHNGSARGQTCGLRFDPRNKLALAVGMNAWQPFLRDMVINHVFGMLRGQPVPPPPRKPLGIPLADLQGRYVGHDGLAVEVTCADAHTLICTLPGPKTAPSLVLTLKLEEGILTMVGDAQHHSIGFFRDEDSGALGLMFGLTACRKQH